MHFCLRGSTLSLSPAPHRLLQVLGIAARVFGVDLAPLTEKMDEVSSFMDKKMLDFNDRVSGVLGEAAVKGVSAGVSYANVAALERIQEFRDTTSPDSAAVSQIILPKMLEGDALDQLLSAVQELGNDMQSSRQYINGLHCYTVKRPTAALPDKVMWLCEHHKSLLEHWDSNEITEVQLLERVMDPKAAAAATSPPSPAPRPASAPSTPQPLRTFSSTPSGFFPSSLPPELKGMSREAVATHIKAIGKSYEPDSQILVDEGYDGKMIGTFCGRADSDVLQDLETAGIKSNKHRDRILVAFKDLFDPQTYAMSPAPVNIPPRPQLRSASHVLHPQQAQPRPPLPSAGLPASHADPVLQSHLHSLTNAAVPFKKKHRVFFALKWQMRWQERYMAVRDGILFYADTFDDVLLLVSRRSYKPGDVHAIELKGCRAEECAAETDSAHWAFTLTAAEVMLPVLRRASTSTTFCRGGSFFFPPAMLR